MINATFITTAPTSAAPDRKPLVLLPIVSYEDRFERDGRWLMGPYILRPIAWALREKSLRGLRLLFSLLRFAVILGRGNDEGIRIRLIST